MVPGSEPGQVIERPPIPSGAVLHRRGSPRRCMASGRPPQPQEACPLRDGVDELGVRGARRNEGPAQTGARRARCGRQRPNLDRVVAHERRPQGCARPASRTVRARSRRPAGNPSADVVRGRELAQIPTEAAGVTADPTASETASCKVRTASRPDRVPTRPHDGPPWIRTRRVRGLYRSSSGRGLVPQHRELRRVRESMPSFRKLRLISKTRSIPPTMRWRDEQFRGDPRSEVEVRVPRHVPSVGWTSTAHGRAPSDRSPPPTPSSGRATRGPPWSGRCSRCSGPARRPACWTSAPAPGSSPRRCWSSVR